MVCGSSSFLSPHPPGLLRWFCPAIWMLWYRPKIFLLQCPHLTAWSLPLRWLYPVPWIHRHRWCCSAPRLCPIASSLCLISSRLPVHQLSVRLSPRLHQKPPGLRETLGLLRAQPQSVVAQLCSRCSQIKQFEKYTLYI